MSQTQEVKVVPSKQGGTSLDSVKKEFEQIITTGKVENELGVGPPQQEQQQTMRDVFLKVYVNCPCGIDYVKFKRSVPFDSPLNDHDILDPNDIDMDADELVGYY